MTQDKREKAGGKALSGDGRAQLIAPLLLQSGFAQIIYNFVLFLQLCITKPHEREISHQD